MTERRTHDPAFTAFFREEAVTQLGLADEGAPAGRTVIATSVSPGLPALPPAAGTAGEKEKRAYWRMLRTFFRSGKGPKAEGETPAPEVYPLLLDLYRHAGFLPSGYPLWAAGPSTGGEAQPPERLMTVTALLDHCTARFASGEGQGRILKDNLPRLELIIRKKLDFADMAYQAGPVWAEALEDLAAQLDIKGREGETFREDVASLKRELPASGFLIPCGRLAPFHVLAAFLESFRLEACHSLRDDIAHLSGRLHDLLIVEREKSPEARSPEQLHAALDFADAFLQFEELSSLLPQGGSPAMPEERLHRIEKILETVAGAETHLIGRKATIVVAAEMADLPAADWLEVFNGATLIRARPGEACAAASTAFDEQMEQSARIFAAIRLGRLETQDAYRPDIHGDFFEHFGWRSFSEEETALCPPVILLADSASLMEKELNAFSGLLASNRPVKMVAIRMGDGAVGIGSDRNPAGLFRQQPGALAIAHRNAFVLQGSGIDPLALFSGFGEGFSVPAPALFHLHFPAFAGEGPGFYLLASAAAEARAFPAFVYNSAKGPGWGSRFNVAANPHPEGDWPIHRVKVKEAEGAETDLELAFTFADYAALDPSFAGHFHLLPPEYWDEQLLPLATYLSLPADDHFNSVPYIWVLDGKRLLHKAALDWSLVLMCRERLDFWRYLQENAGVHSYHVEKAVAALRLEMEEKQARQEASLKEIHLRELEEARDEATRTAMERLASALLDLDTAQLTAVVTTSPVQAPAKPAAPAPAPAEQEIPQAPPPAEKVSLALGEVWIDTPLCTSCNECIDTNKRIFKYNAEKQAYVDNPRGGPFADIVKAAESCPAKIIHPGAPQDPSEPDLENLVKRAAPFQ